MQPLLTKAQMQDVDRAAVQSIGIPELVLMEHAGLALVKALDDRYGTALSQTEGLVLAGTGNNGGDVIAAARMLHGRGINLNVVLLGSESSLSASCALQLKIVQKLGVSFQRELDESRLKSCDWVLDGILGTGLSKPVSEPLFSTIQKINTFCEKKWVVAADIPSGLSADTGMPLGIAVKAAHTVVLGFLKKGLVTGEAADYVGVLSLSPIEIPRETNQAVDTFLWDTEDAKRISPRKAASHKGTFGHVYVYLGEKDKEGAAVLACHGAIRAGCGLVTLVGEKSRLESVRTRLIPEIMTEEIGNTNFGGKTCVIGPGLGVGQASWELLKDLLKTDSHLVIDGDALTLLANHAEESKNLLRDRAQKKNVTVLTPHPKEASRLLASSIEGIQKDRFQACTKLTEEYRSWVVLKGRGTLIKGMSGPIFVVNRGNSSLAKAGTGDLLTGIAAAFIAQGIPVVQALPLAVYVHGRSAELLSQKIGNERTPLATEIAENFNATLRELNP